jgi:hypothetical protein
MKKRIIHIAICIATYSFLLLSGCQHPYSNPFRFSSYDNERWISGQKSGPEFKSYYETNIDKINPMEGIWDIKLNDEVIYEIAIIKYQPDKLSEYEYVGIILASSSDQEEPGSVKVRFQTISDSGVFKGLWRYANEETIGIKSFIRMDKLTINDADSDLVFTKIYPIDQ